MTKTTNIVRKTTHPHTQLSCPRVGKAGELELEINRLTTAAVDTYSDASMRIRQRARGCATDAHLSLEAATSDGISPT